ncbi:MAG: GldG family protein [Anaerolineales bacterium]|nr:GldG family protein [Anaerolineales bacterium]
MTKKRSQKKTPSAKQLAPIGLWVSGVSILVTIFLLLVKLVIFLDLLLLPNQDLLNRATWIFSGLIPIGIAAYALMNPDGISRFFAGRQARHGSNAVIVTIAFLAIIVVIGALSRIANQRWDWTADKQHTLAPETLTVLNALPQPVHAIAFYTSPTQEVTDLLDDIVRGSDEIFDYEVVNPDTNPGLALQYEVTRDGTIVLVMGEQRELVAYPTEQEITNALIRLINPEQRTVYFLIGHGEYDINQSGEQGYASFRQALEAKNYTVLTLNLRALNQIPADAKLIVIAGAAQPISSDELTLIASYLAGGGSLVVLSEPPYFTQTAGLPDPLADYLATAWNIRLNNDVIIDPSSNQPIIAISNSYATHAITENLQTTMTYYPTARSITVTNDVLEVYASSLVQTIDRSWGETDMNSLNSGSVEFNANQDNPGPTTVVVVAENSVSGARVIVFGDSDFASDLAFSDYGNRDIALNSVDWAAQQENIISLTSAEPIERSLLPISRNSLLLLGVAFICVVPLLIIVGGVASWLIRRSQG